MIVQVRGTSGSGKSYIVRTFMENHLGWQPHHITGRKQPLGYSQGGVWIVGHYLCASGGADTLRPLDYIAEVIAQRAQTYHVLFEGLLWSWETWRTVKLASSFDMKILSIDISVKQCLEAINNRRRAKNPNAELVNPRQTVVGARYMESSLKKLKENGVSCWKGTREEVAIQLEQWLGEKL